MKKQITLLAFVAFVLVGCHNVRQLQVSPAPVVDLSSAPGEQTPVLGEPGTQATGENAATSVPEQTRGAYLEGDGPGKDIPPNLDQIPDAVPKDEPLHRYANRPYVALGKTYTPLLITGNYKEEGIASWYGKKFHGQRTSIGEVYDMYGMTASHPILPIPSYARVTNLSNNKSVVVRVNDRGPFLHDRIIDLSYAAAYKLGIINNGTARVLVESIAVDNNNAATVSTAQPVPVKSEALALSPTPMVSVAPLPAPVPAPTPAIAESSKPSAESGNVFLQLGAFKTAANAKNFMGNMRSRISSTGKSLSAFQKDGLQEVLLGPYATEKEALADKQKLLSEKKIKSYIRVHN